MLNKYNVIINFIEKKIKDKELRPGDKVPSVRDLAEIFKVSKSTIIKAYNELQRKHILYSIPRSGYYVIETKTLTYDIKTNIMDFSKAAPSSDLLPYIQFQNCINQAIDIYKEKLFTYTNPKGLSSLRKILVKHLYNHQIFTKPNNIFITSGTQQAIDILSRISFPNDNDTILVEQPTYSIMIKNLNQNNVKSMGIKRFNDLDLNQLEDIFKRDNIKFFYTIPRFSNPTGTSIGNEKKKQIVKLAEKYDVYIVEDDYLADLRINKKLNPIYTYDNNKRVIYLKSFSKTLLPGLRIGMVILPDSLMEVFKNNKKISDINTSVLSQGALEIFIKSRMFEKHIKKIKGIYSDRMKILKDISKDLLEEDIYVPNTGFFASVRLPNYIDLQKLIYNLKLRNVYVSNSKDFYLDNFKKDNFLRLSICRMDKNKIYDGLKTINKEIKRLK
ncbi:MAG: PLP-dependent aminotransferase family protein [Firmicutes bacterium]|nr:PLP-dependent aminotransferase family protein [Bacillota bacterium]